MDDQRELVEGWKRDGEAPIVGWDFSYLDGRMFEETPPWSYLDRARGLLRQADSVLDLGTGGGERLLEIRDAWPAKVVVTEQHPPNYRLVQDRLTPLGVSVFDVTLSLYDPLPFEAGEFGVVLDRHAAFNADEVARVISSGGAFLTQQVHGQAFADLMDAFGARPQWPYLSPEFFKPKLEGAGFVIEDVQEWWGEIEFADVGAIVYFLSAAPWQVPDFSVDKYIEHLMALQARVEAGEPLRFATGNYLIEARKP